MSSRKNEIVIKCDERVLDCVYQCFGELFDASFTMSMTSDESINVKCSQRDSSKPSTANYRGPDGRFTVTFNPETRTATALADFATGKFKSTVTENSITMSGVSPVYNKWWGFFHDAFTGQI